MPVIFISYRRSDSQDVTGRIYDRLVGKFSPKQVFKDVDNIPLGVSFALHIQQMIGKANVALVIIGPNWLTATDEQGRRRLDDPTDFVRVEVESALRAGMPVVPVVVSNAVMPKASELPKSIQKLVARNGMAVRPDPDFNNDIGRLFSGIDHLERLLNKVQPITVIPILSDDPAEEEIVVEVVRDAPPPRRKERVSGVRRKRASESIATEGVLSRVARFGMGGAASGLFVLAGGVALGVFFDKAFQGSLAEFSLMLAITSVVGAFFGFPFGVVSGCFPAPARHPVSLSLLWGSTLCAITLPFFLDFDRGKLVGNWVNPLAIAAAAGAAFGLFTGIFDWLFERGSHGYFTLLGLVGLFALSVLGTYGAVLHYRTRPPQAPNVPIKKAASLMGVRACYTVGGQE